MIALKPFTWFLIVAEESPERGLVNILKDFLGTAGVGVGAFLGGGLDWTTFGLGDGVEGAATGRALIIAFFLMGLGAFFGDEGVSFLISASYSFFNFGEEVFFEAFMYHRIDFGLCSFFDLISFLAELRSKTSPM